MMNSILETIKIIVENKYDNLDFTKSYTGVIKSVSDNIAKVEIGSDVISAQIPESLMRFITIDNLVVIQDLYNTGKTMFVQGVIGNRAGVGILRVVDPETGEIISFSFRVFDTETNQVVGTIFDVR